MIRYAYILLLLCVGTGDVFGQTSPILNSNRVHQMITNFAGGSGTGLSPAATTNAAAGIATFTNTLYVAPWGNNSTATRGRLDLPYTLSNAFVQVRNNERIAIMGSNFVSVRVPLPIGSSYAETNVMTAPLLLSNKTGVTIQGVAGGGVYWTNYGTVATFFNTTNITIENLEWNGTVKRPIYSGGVTNGLASAIILLTSGNNITFRGNKFKNFASQGIYALNVLKNGRSQMNNVSVVDNYFDNIGDDTFRTDGDGTAIVPVGDNWIISRNSFQNLLRGIENYTPSSSHGTQSGHLYSDNLFSNISHVAIFQLNEGNGTSNTIRGLKISDNVIYMSRTLPGTISQQLGGMELRGPLLNPTIVNNTVVGTNNLMTWGINLISSQGEIGNVLIANNNIEGFYFRAIQVTDDTTTNRVRRFYIANNKMNWGQIGWLASGLDGTVIGNRTDNVGSYAGYVAPASSDMVIMNNVNGNGTYYVDATAVNTVFMDNWYPEGFALSGNGEPVINGTGVNTRTNSVWKYNFQHFPGITSIVDDRVSSGYITNGYFYNVREIMIPRDSGSYDRYVILTNTAANGKRWDLQIINSGNKFQLLNHTDNIEAFTLTTNGTLTVPGSVVSAFTNQSYYLRTFAESYIEDLRANAAYLTNAAVLNATSFKMSRDIMTDTRFMRISNAIAGGASWVFNMYTNNASVGWREEIRDRYSLQFYTNGSMSLGEYNTAHFTNFGKIFLKGNDTNASPSIMLTRNPTTGAIEDSAVPAGGSVTTNFTTIAAGSGTFGSVVATNTLDAGTITATNLMITFLTVPVGIANSNLTVNFNIASQDIYLTNSTTTFTNLVGLVATNQANITLRITPVSANRTITWPTLGGNSFGARFLTNANSPIWTTITNPVVVSMSAWGTNVHISMSEWK